MTDAVREARPTTAATTYRWVVRDELGAWVETHACETREQAIRLFCHPALLWPPFEEDGWTITQEPLTAPLGEPSIACMEGTPPPEGADGH